MLSVFAVVGYFTKDFKTVTISYKGELYEITTRAETVAAAIEDAGIVIEDKDRVNYDLTCNLDDVDEVITVTKPIILTVTMANEVRIITTYSDNISGILSDNGIDINDPDVSVDVDNENTPGNDDWDGDTGDNDNVYNEVTPDEIIDVVIKSTKTVEESETLWFDTVYVNDSSLYKGEYEIVTEGQNGFIKRVYSVDYEDGVEVSRTLVSEVKTEPVNKVVAVGTKIYFTNSRGGNDSYTASYEMVATAYAPTPENWGYATASGNRARDGVVAVDTDVIPLGTKLYVKSNAEGVPDYGYCIAWDIGGAIQNMRIDLFMESESDCHEFGMRDVTVYVLEDQSIDVFSMRYFLDDFGKQM